MSAAQEVPPTGTAGTGACDVSVDDVSNLVSASCTFSGLSAPASAAHIHGLAAFGTPAGIILPFTAPPPPAATSGTTGGSQTLTPDQVAGIIAGQAYTNIHSTAFGAGEIRGQIGDFAVSAPTIAAYVINGASNPSLTLTRGKTYQFQVDSTGHPFFIKTAQVTGSGSTFDTGVTNNGTQLGTLSFTVPASAPSTLFYQCGVHTQMTGTIAIVSPPVPATGVVAIAVLCALLLAGGLVALRRRGRATVATA
jgi:hypothetical protein